MDINRVVIVVFDSLGVCALPDAADYGDVGSHTLDNMAAAAGGIDVPTLASLGVGNIKGVRSVKAAPAPIGAFGRMAEASKGKDTQTGHWEMAGLITEKALATFPEGLPTELLEKFTEETGHRWLFGKPASGTEIIKSLGEEHLKTGALIVYNSADSVFQIAAHDDVVPTDELYRVCRVTRKLLDDGGEYAIGRVIARPFTGAIGDFKRTDGRKDFTIEPPGETVLDLIKKAGHPVTAIGKIGDIFSGRGITSVIKTKSNAEGMEKTVEAVKDGGGGARGLIFTNLVDFDMDYGHRNDPGGYARCLEEADQRLAELIGALGPEDILVVTADHGCDPTTPSTDHSREYVPLLVYGRALKAGVDLGTRGTFADLGATVAEALGVRGTGAGTSFLAELLGEGEGEVKEGRQAGA